MIYRRLKLSNSKYAEFSVTRYWWKRNWERGKTSQRWGELVCQYSTCQNFDIWFLASRDNSWRANRNQVPVRKAVSEETSQAGTSGGPAAPAPWSRAPRTADSSPPASRGHLSLRRPTRLIAKTELSGWKNHESHNANQTFLQLTCQGDNNLVVGCCYYAKTISVTINQLISEISERHCIQYATT